MASAPANPIRVILHLDFDSFEIQCIEDHPYLDKAVVAVNSSHLVLSMTQSAKKVPGITRGEYIDIQAYRERFPDLIILEVKDDQWGKPESKPKRIASFKVMDVIRSWATNRGVELVEKNSLDDLFIDITKIVATLAESYADGTWEPKRDHMWNIHVETEHGSENYYDVKAHADGGNPEVDTHLLIGASVAQELLMKVSAWASFSVSIGVATNKSLAKIATTLHRPFRVSAVLPSALPRISEQVKASKVSQMGGDRGSALLKEFGPDLTIAQLTRLDFCHLERHLGPELGPKIRDRARGIDPDPVIRKLMSNKISCGRTLDYASSIAFVDIQEEIQKLCEQMVDQNLTEEAVYNHRVATRFRLDVESRSAAAPNFSCSFTIASSDLRSRVKNENDMTALAVAGLYQNGYKFGRSSVRKLTLTADMWEGTGTTPRILPV